jgi:hypothetical protein
MNFGQKSIYAKQAYEGNYIGADYGNKAVLLLRFPKVYDKPYKIIFSEEG